jgi:hypothetical protein
LPAYFLSIRNQSSYAKPKTHRDKIGSGKSKLFDNWNHPYVLYRDSFDMSMIAKAKA